MRLVGELRSQLQVATAARACNMHVSLEVERVHNLKNTETRRNSLNTWSGAFTNDRSSRSFRFVHLRICPAIHIIEYVNSVAGAFREPPAVNTLAGSCITLFSLTILTIVQHLEPSKSTAASSSPLLRCVLEGRVYRNACPAWNVASLESPAPPQSKHRLPVESQSPSNDHGDPNKGSQCRTYGWNLCRHDS